RGVVDRRAGGIDGLCGRPQRERRERDRSYRDTHESFHRWFPDSAYRAVRSSERAAESMLVIPWLPSWQAYSNTPALSGRFFMSSAAVHAAVQVAGSSNLTWYSTVWRRVRVKASISLRPGDEPRVFALRFVVSTTSASPSQRP